MIDPRTFANLVDESLLLRSGSVFYSGQRALSHPTPLYILGLNPGGCPSDKPEETIGRNLKNWPNLPQDWSAYQDDSWEGRKAGTYGMQPRVVHLIRKLGMDPQRVPASNVVFVRTRNEVSLAAEKQSLLKACWPVHEAVIERFLVGRHAA